MGKDANGNVAPFKKDRIRDFEVCVHDHVHYADGNGQYIPDWQRKSIRLHPAFALVDEQDATRDPAYAMKFYASGSSAPSTSTTNYRIDYKFKLPNLNYDASKPAVFRWYGSAVMTFNVIALLPMAHGCFQMSQAETHALPTIML